MTSASDYKKLTRWDYVLNDTNVDFLTLGSDFTMTEQI